MFFSLFELEGYIVFLLNLKDCFVDDLKLEVKELNVKEIEVVNNGAKTPQKMGD